MVEGIEKGLTDEVHVLYVSPLKALSNDIQKNLQEPLAGIRDQLLEQGVDDVPIRDAVRTGDTSAFERNRMRKTPPHILVTTPESLFILLTSESGRAMLKSVRSVIVDELHSVAGSKRGSHLMLSLERLDALCGKPPVRVGLSATVKPLEAMARFLVGARGEAAEIVDTGHVRERDLALELPRSPLEAIMSNEVWGELYDRLAELIQAHRTTLIFVNNRRLAERATRHLAERVGAENVATHHGSLSKEHRLSAEQRLKDGQLKALVATSSLELGIDIGDIDLVCQMGSPRLISALLQRVGRAGHAVGATPKGRLFPLSLDDLRRVHRPPRQRPARRAGPHPRTGQAARRARPAGRGRSRLPRVGRARNCSTRFAARSPTRISRRRNSSRSCRCSPRATRPGAAGARPTCTTTR